ncbi:hypothetical protein [Dyadobacter sandarakinus]|uniref:Uncharacterized protein n=1 Tax=Dyadobacter sandarakinus TaxID=2747268 RepID=A0ABX7I2R5_9BACT|nr:hypothetical protein [Dyadobacter sandarakinus]QRR00119.1 hypothetical protein HWI92_03940 [Dyadobacter sandarakinus]
MSDYHRRRDLLVNQYIVDHQQLLLVHDAEMTIIFGQGRAAEMELLRRQALEWIALSLALANQLMALDKEFIE